MKRVSFLAIGVLSVSLIAIGIFLSTGTANRAYAQGRTGGTMGTGNMMRNIQGRFEMKEMMKKHHGDNWQDHHNSHNNMMGG